MTRSKKDDTDGAAPAAAAPSAPLESESYQEMLSEVEALVRDVAAPDVDLDAMVRKIERGYGLIKAMRTRLEETKQRVEELRVAFE